MDQLTPEEFAYTLRSTRRSYEEGIEAAEAKITKHEAFKRYPEEEDSKLLPRLKAGTTTMGAERDRLGNSSDRPIRLALIEILGSRKEYDKLLKSSQAAAVKARKS